eukprot:577695-Rhodomonas_salina.1
MVKRTSAADFEVDQVFTDEKPASQARGFKQLGRVAEVAESGKVLLPVGGPATQMISALQAGCWSYVYPAHFRWVHAAVGVTCSQLESRAASWSH